MKRNSVWTQKEVGRLDRVMQELAEAQKRTEIEIQKLSKGLDETRGEVGGLSKSMSYAFENEAYRSLPAVLKEKYGIEVKERIIRAEIDGGEICNGREIRGWIGLGGKTNEESLWLIYCKTPKNLQ